ncbi:MAG: ribonuclease HI [Deltaproteobacteria bacterium]|nr:ribonuclease HI [Deltaproteobacteria bacterium]
MTSTITVYTDGACSGNPGPAGLGVVLSNGSIKRVISEYLGSSTNNIAELTAILRALQAVKNKKAEVLIHTDSSYSIGVLSKGWKAKANVELITEIRLLMTSFPRLRLIKVEGHSGVEGNEEADSLAREAVENRKNRDEYISLNSTS